jgi:hypothetical protein
MHNWVLFICPRPRTFCLRAPQNVRTSAWAVWPINWRWSARGDADNVTGRDYALLHQGRHRARLFFLTLVAGLLAEPWLSCAAMALFR